MLSHIATWLPSSPSLLSLCTFQSYTSLLQAFFLILVLYTALTRAYLPRRSRTFESPSMEHEHILSAQKIASWTPQPLANPVTSPATEAAQAGHIAGGRILLTSVAGPSVDVLLEGPDQALPSLTNLSSLNFLGLAGDASIAASCAKTMASYGCGACGPRGFYGTVAPHLACEASLARLLDVPDAILYSFGSSVQSSVVPAFCKRGDVVVVDDGVSFALQTGIRLSRADIRYFAHNDMADLRRVLDSVVAGDKADRSRATRQRRFVVAEAVYANYGDVAPLDQIVGLKNDYSFRLILDESLSLGSLGASGRGALEHFHVPRNEVEIATADLGNAFATVGGVCVGEPGVVSHQRLSGAGYCFSAAQPPFLATAATEAVKALDERGGELIARLRKNCGLFRDALGIARLREGGWRVDGDLASPLLHVRVAEGRKVATQVEMASLQEKCIYAGVLVAAPRYVADEAWRPAPSLRLSISAAHSESQLQDAAEKIAEVLLESPRPPL